MPNLLKDIYNTKYIAIVSCAIKTHYNSFDVVGFENTIFESNWNDKELKQRMRHIANTFHAFLPFDYQKQIEILKKSFFDINYDFGLENMIFQDFVQTQGMEYFDISMDALRCFTINSSSEFAIREFILKYPSQTMSQMMRWADDENEHIRRLASEGSRPRLPWAISLPIFIKNPQQNIQILEKLQDDTSAYVRKSVANHINDISKDNAKLAIALVKKWQNNKNKEKTAMIKHAMRTLLKLGDVEVLEIFGYVYPKGIDVVDFVACDEVKMYEDLNLCFTIKSKDPLGKIRLEYSIDFVRLNDKYNNKVFKISEFDTQNSTKTVSKKHSFKKISTRKYYTGKHFLHIIINGKIVKTHTFDLK